MANPLLDEAKRRVTEIGSRERAIAAIAQVPNENKFVFAQAINDVFPAETGALGGIRQAEAELGTPAEFATPPESVWTLC